MALCHPARCDRHLHRWVSHAVVGTSLDEEPGTGVDRASACCETETEIDAGFSQAMTTSAHPFPTQATDSLTEQRSKQRELWLRYNQNQRGTSAEGDLVSQYLPLVKTVVGRLAMTLPTHVDIEDLYSVGTGGLLDALRNFDQAHGASFETYARIRIRGAVIDELRRMDWVPRSVHEK